ncbi:hypothetical protein ACFW16_32655 [Inquilinus sp. NPDC058860]|uniref:hypothetical protein n=1 Tax=Inquilinus sp. NPDC058860 TaxID=3346652 RepID=UPI00369FB8F8
MTKKHAPELAAVARIFEGVLIGFDFGRADHPSEVLVPGALKVRAMEVFLQRLQVWRLNRTGDRELVPIEPGAPDDELEHWFDVMLQTVGEFGIWLVPTRPGISDSQ